MSNASSGCSRTHCHGRTREAELPSGQRQLGGIEPGGRNGCCGSSLDSRSTELTTFKPSSELMAPVIPSFIGDSRVADKTVGHVRWSALGPAQRRRTDLAVRAISSFAGRFERHPLNPVCHRCPYKPSTTPGAFDAFHPAQIVRPCRPQAPRIDRPPACRTVPRRRAAAGSAAGLRLPIARRRAAGIHVHRRPRDRSGDDRPTARTAEPTSPAARHHVTPFAWPIRPAAG